MQKNLTTLILCFFLSCVFILPANSEVLITDGKGIWLNIWNYPENPDLFCEHLKVSNIDTLYLQISRSNTKAIVHPNDLGKIIKSAHERNIMVIGWTYPFLKDPSSDAHKFIQVAKFKTPEGDTLDGVAADIEEVTNSKSIEKFSKIIRRSLGADFPLIAITFSPMLRRASPSQYAWHSVAEYFDILCPMTYWTWSEKYRSEKGAYTYTAQTIEKLREYTKNKNLQIHLIGDGQKTSSSEIKGFLKAAKDYGITGVSLYPWYKPTKKQVDILGKFEI